MDAQPLPPIPGGFAGSPREIDDHNYIVCQHAKVAFDKFKEEMLELAKWLQDGEDKEINDWFPKMLDDTWTDTFDSIMRAIENRRGEGYEEDGEPETHAWAREHSVAWRNGR